MSKGFRLEFEEPPKAEREGREPSPIYKDTINAFLDSGKDYAKLDVQGKLSKLQGKNPLQSIRIGLSNAIKKSKADDKVKVITRKNSIYLVTKVYSEKQKWAWKTTRKSKNK